MSTNIIKTGLVNCSPREGFDTVSILKNDIEVGANLLKRTVNPTWYLDGSDYPTRTSRTNGCVEYIDSTPGNYVNAYYWAYLEGSNNLLESLDVLKAGHTYTFSVDARIENFTITTPDMISFGFDWRTTGTWSAKYAIKTYINKNCPTWTRFSASGTIPASTDIGKCLIAFGAKEGSDFGKTGAKIYFKNFKLEIGSAATPWCPSTSDNMGPKLGIVTDPININQLYEF